MYNFRGQKIFLFLLAAIFLSSSTLFAEEDLTALKGQADSQVMAASRLMQEGVAKAKANPSKGSRQAAVQLLIEAGQLFEKASVTYQSLVPQYASASDVENSRNAMENCIRAISQLKQGLNR